MDMSTLKTPFLIIDMAMKLAYSRGNKKWENIYL